MCILWDSFILQLQLDLLDKGWICEGTNLTLNGSQFFFIFFWQGRQFLLEWMRAYQGETWDQPQATPLL